MLCSHHRIKHIAQLICDGADIPCQQGAFHFLMVGVPGDRSLVQFTVQLRGGRRKVRLAYNEYTVRQIRQLAKPLTSALHHRRAAQGAEWNIASHLSAQFRQSQNGQGRTAVLIQRPQYRCGVRASAAQTCLRGNPLGDTDLDPVRVIVHGLAIDLCGLPRQIGFILRDTFRVADQLPGLAGAHIDFHVIPQGNGLHNAADIVIAILPLTENIQRQIYFGKCAFIQRCHLIFRPSR